MTLPHQIPRIIHYCWFGSNPVSKRLQTCIASWRKFCPDFKIMEWNEEKFDLSTAPGYVRQAYSAQKWAFVADYVRLFALLKYGGVYLDTDVELIRPLEPFMHAEAFAGFEDSAHIATCVLACEPQFPLFQEFLSQYVNMQFQNADGTLNTKTNVTILTDICKKKGLAQNGQLQTVSGLTLYPADCFCPLEFKTGLLRKTENTVAIHWLDGSWWDEERKCMWDITRRLGRVFPEKFSERLGKAIVLIRYRGLRTLARSVLQFCRRQRTHGQ